MENCQTYQEFNVFKRGETAKITYFVRGLAPTRWENVTEPLVYDRDQAVNREICDPQKDIARVIAEHMNPRFIPIFVHSFIPQETYSRGDAIIIDTHGKMGALPDVLGGSEKIELLGHLEELLREKE